MIVQPRHGWRQIAADRMAGYPRLAFVPQRGGAKENRRFVQTLCRYPAVASGGRAEKQLPADAGRL